LLRLFGVRVSVAEAADAMLAARAARQCSRTGRRYGRRCAVTLIKDRPRRRAFR